MAALKSLCKSHGVQLSPTGDGDLLQAWDLGLACDPMEDIRIDDCTLKKRNENGT